MTTIQPETIASDPLAAGCAEGIAPDLLRIKDANEEAFAREFAGNVEVLTALPIQVDFETTTRCNLRCLTCPKTYNKDNGRDAERELFDRFAEATFRTARSINLTGFGEPMLSPNFPHFFERSVAAGLDVGFVTNGTYLSDEWIERFSVERVQLFLSIDAAHAAPMKIMRPQLDFAKLRASLEAYRQARERNGARHRARLSFQMVPTLRNLDELPAIIEWAAEVGAYRLEVFNMRTGGLSPAAVAQHIRNDPERTRRVFEAARRRAADVGLPLTLPQGYDRELDGDAASAEVEVTAAPQRANPPGSKYPLACTAPWFRINVEQNGDVRPCCWYPWAMGNLYRQSFEEIWNGERYRQMRRRINSRFPQYGCKTCVMAWGITAGRPDLIFEQERLLDRVHTRVQRWRHERATRGGAGG